MNNLDQEWSSPIRADLEFENKLGIASTVEFKRTLNGAVATLIFTCERPNGLVDLIAIIHQSVPEDEKEALAQIEHQMLNLSEAFSWNQLPLHLKDAQRALSQDEVSRMAIGIMSRAQGSIRAKNRSTDESVLVQTAILWRLLKQLGSSKPAEVLGSFFNAKPKTINARLTAARDQNLIVRVQRNSVNEPRNRPEEGEV